MKRNVIIGLALVLSLGGLSAEGAEPQGKTPARVVESAAPAPTVIDRLVGTIRAIPGLGRLVGAKVPAAPTAPSASTGPSLVFPNDFNLLDLPDCSPLLDPQVECRVRQPLG